MAWGDYGILGAVLSAMSTAIGVIIRIIYVRLLDKNEGLLTKLAERHIEFVDALQSGHVEVVEILRSQEGHLGNLTILHEATDSKFATVKINRAMWHHADGMLYHIGGNAEKAEESFLKVKESIAGVE